MQETISPDHLMTEHQEQEDHVRLVFPEEFPSLLLKKGWLSCESPVRFHMVSHMAVDCNEAVNGGKTPHLTAARRRHVELLFHSEVCVWFQSAESHVITCRKCCITVSSSIPGGE